MPQTLQEILNADEEVKAIAWVFAQANPDSDMQEWRYAKAFQAVCLKLRINPKEFNELIKLYK